MDECRAGERLQLVVTGGPADAEHLPARRLEESQAELVESAAQRHVSDDQPGPVVAVVVDHHFIVDRQQGTVVRLHGEAIEAVRLDVHVAIEPDAVVCFPAELREVERVCIAGGHGLAGPDVPHRRELSLEQLERQSRLRTDARYGIPIRAAQEIRAIDDALPADRRGDQDAQRRLQTRRQRNLQWRLEARRVGGRIAAIERVMDRAFRDQRMQVDDRVILRRRIKIPEAHGLGNPVVHGLLLEPPELIGQPAQEIAVVLAGCRRPD